MKNLLAVLTIFIFIPIDEIQAQDHLTPAMSSFGWQSRKDMLIKELLFDGDNSPIASFMIGGVSVLVLDWNRNKDNGTKYLLTHRKTTGTSISRAYKEEIFSSEVWRTLDLAQPRVTIKEFEADISDSLAMAIRNLFKTALSQTRMPRHIGLDGVTYTFTSGLDVGEVWYPRAGIKMYKLAKIGMALIEYTKLSPKPDSIAEQTLITQMDRLRKELKVIAPDKLE